MEGIIMKRLLLILMGATFIFFSCSKDDTMGPEPVPNDQNTLKHGMTRVAYTGIETYVSTQDAGEITVLPNGKTLIMGNIVTWHDSTSAWQSTGLTVWNVNFLWDGQPLASSGKYWGRGEMTVDGNRGTWDLPFHGNITFYPDDGYLIFTAYVTGIGKYGEVKGMICHSVDVVDTRLGFYYTINGFLIDKNRMDLHHGHRWHGHR